MQGGQGMAPNMMDMTQNPYGMAPMQFPSPAMQYLLSKMHQSDRDIIGATAGRMGEFGRFIAERTGGFLTQLKGKFNPATPSTMAPLTPGGASSSSSAPATPYGFPIGGAAPGTPYVGGAAPGTPYVAPTPDAEMLPVPEDEFDPFDSRNFPVTTRGDHPVDPQAPFAALPTELHGHARHLMTQGHSAEGACRQIYDN